MTYNGKVYLNFSGFTPQTLFSNRNLNKGNCFVAGGIEADNASQMEESRL